jgi:hypothetical protein
MFKSALRYFLRHPIRAVASVASDPVEAWIAFHERMLARRQRPVPPVLYRADPDWERRLHDLLELPWPCPTCQEFRDLWPQVVAQLEGQGVRAGPQSFKGWNDGDAGLVRAIWCLTRHLRPDKVVETGVAHGVTSRFILEALERNGAGHLWSVDYPPFDKSWHDQIGIAVGAGLRTRWSYVRGSSKRRLPSLLAELGQIDLFIHDSLHSEDNVRFEVDRAWAALRPGGAVVVDDIDANWGFQTFTQSRSDCAFMICEAEPLRPDLRRFNQKGLFGIALKSPPASSASKLR